MNQDELAPMMPQHTAWFVLDITCTIAIVVQGWWDTNDLLLG